MQMNVKIYLFLMYIVTQALNSSFDKALISYTVFYTPDFI